MQGFERSSLDGLLPFSAAVSRVVNRPRGLHLVVLLGSLGLNSCTDVPRPFTTETLSQQTAQSRARISFSYPQVFSRESLINDRLKEGQFLEELLVKSADAQFDSQLRRDLSTISAMTTQLGITFDPTAKLSLDRAKELDDVKQEIELTKLRAELLRVQQQYNSQLTNGGAGTAAPSTATAGQAAGLSIDQSNTKAKLDALVASAKEAVDQFVKAQSTGARKAGGTQAPEDRFKDLRVYRDQLRSALNSAKLDDVHDREGNALYRMQFVATVFPGREETDKQWGVARIEVKPPILTDEDIERLYLRWLKHSTERLNQVNEKGEASGDLLYSSVVNDNRLLGLVSLQPTVYSPSALPKGKRKEILFVAVNPDVALSIKGLIIRKAEIENMTLALKNFFVAFPTQGDVKDGRDVSYKDCVNGKAKADACVKARGAVDVTNELRDALKVYLGTAPTTCIFLDPKDNGPWKRHREIFRIAETIAISNPFLQAAAQGAASVQGERERLLGEGAEDLGFQRLKDTADDAGDALWLVKELYGLVGKPCEIALASLLKAESRVRVPVAFTRAIRKSSSASSCESAASLQAPGIAPLTKSDTACGTSVVYSVTPVEGVQRVSNVASAANSAQMALALSAGMPSSGVGVQAGAGHLQSAIGNADALERVPLVVAFSDHGADPIAGQTNGRDGRFGWVFGPQSYIDTPTSGKSRIGLRHVVSAHSVAVEISMPVWWSTFELDIMTAWVSNAWTNPNDYLDRSDESIHNRQSMKVNRPLSIGDLDSLTGYLLRVFPPFAIRPVRIDRVEPPNLSVCDKGSEITLLLYGLNLWRNPEAYFLGRKATKIHVLPDMQGIAASFDLSGVRITADSARPIVVWTQSGPAESAVHLKLSKGACDDKQGVKP